MVVLVSRLLLLFYILQILDFLPLQLLEDFIKMSMFLLELNQQQIVPIFIVFVVLLFVVIMLLFVILLFILVLSRL